MSKMIKTPKFRLCFPNLDVVSETTGKYGITMIFDSDADLNAMKELAKEAKKEKFGDKDVYTPSIFRKGVQKSEEHPNGYDLSKYPAYEGKIIVVANGNVPPALRQADASVLVDAKELYSGCYATAVVSFFAYAGYTDKNTGNFVSKPGISVNLHAVQKLYDGERLGGVDVNKAADEFFKPVKPAAVGSGSLLSDEDDI